MSNETERAGGRGEVSVLLFPCWSNDLRDTVDEPRTFTFAKEYFFRNKSTLFTVYLNELKSKIAGRSYRCKLAVSSVHPSRKFLIDFRGSLLNLGS